MEIKPGLAFSLSLTSLARNQDQKLFLKLPKDDGKNDAKLIFLSSFQLRILGCHITQEEPANGFITLLTMPIPRNDDGH